MTVEVGAFADIERLGEFDPPPDERRKTVSRDSGMDARSTSSVDDDWDV